MLILLIISLVLVATGIVLLSLFDDGDNAHIVGFCLVLLFGIGSALTVILWASSYYDYKAEIRQYYAVKATVEQARKNGASDIERAALTTKIIEMNAWLANVQYKNERFYGDMVPDEVADLKPLE